ncbi:MAG: S1C family serine protease [Planctomycetota bacterium]
MSWRQVVTAGVVGGALLLVSAAPVQVPLDRNEAAVTLDDLRTLQDKVAETTRRVLPAVVGIRAGTGQGSGVIVSPDGFVLTASHVVAGAERDRNRVTVIFPDGTEARARLVDRRPVAGNDSALVKITTPAPAGGFPFAPVGRSTNLAGGEWSIAAGHPGGYRADRPPVIRLGRILFNGDFIIVTDNTLVGGDSGGPLFDLDGRVIGIHSRIGEQTSDNKHVPIDLFIRQWLDEELNNGWAEGNTPQMAEDVMPVIGVATNDPDGPARVEEVSPRSPADRAGLRPGDVIRSFNDTPIRTFNGLVRAVSRTRPGDVVEVVVDRPGLARPIALDLTVGNIAEARRGW